MIEIRKREMRLRRGERVVTAVWSSVGDSLSLILDECQCSSAPFLVLQLTGKQELVQKRERMEETLELCIRD